VYITIADRDCSLGLDVRVGRGLGTSERSGSVVLLDSVLSGMGTFSMSVTEGKDELVKRSSGPKDEDEENGLGISTTQRSESQGGHTRNSRIPKKTSLLVADP
jgi:hypothetical protein